MSLAQQLAGTILRQETQGERKDLPRRLLRVNVRAQLFWPGPLKTCVNAHLALALGDGNGVPVWTQAAPAASATRWLVQFVYYNGETVFVNTCRVPLHA